MDLVPAPVLRDLHHGQWQASQPVTKCTAVFFAGRAKRKNATMCAVSIGVMRQ